MQTWMLLTRRVNAILRIGVLVVAAGLAWILRPSAAESTSTEHDVRILRMLDETAQSTTPAQWKRASDVVVVAHVTSEKRGTKDSSTNTTGRTVRLTTDEVVWRHRGARRVPRGTLELFAFGWARDNGVTYELTGPGSRLEVGHSYVVALTWLEDVCRKDGTVRELGHWMVIGSGGALPADDGVVGRGEYEGTAVARATTEGLEPGSVLTLARDKDPAVVQDLLEQAPAAHRRVDYQKGQLRFCR